MKYGSLLKYHHLKVTPQRIAIMELMHKRGHISIDDLYTAIRKRFASISLATLYKNIHRMIDVSLIQEVKIPGYKSKYEIEKEAHAHVICKICGNLEDLHFDPTNILENVLTTSQYTVDKVSLIISGFCPDCQKK